MGELIIIRKSVGKNGLNQPDDVLKIGVALAAVGPDRGGLFAPPLSVGGLAEAIRSFQQFQSLPIRDGKVDPSGKTLRRINEILNPGILPPSPQPHPATGIIRPLTIPGMPTAIASGVFTPEPVSFRNEFVFQWLPLGGSGNIHYFELDEEVVPNWFGVLVPTGLTSFENIHLFFHPTPRQGKFFDENYKSKIGWSGLFHYLTDMMAIQFCAANSGQVLVMPLLTQNVSDTCGILPKRWESLISQMLERIASRSVAISSVVVSSFSSGITYSAAFRRNAGLGRKLRGIIDFDGMFSTFRQHSKVLPPSAVRVWQNGATPQDFKNFVAQNIFPVPPKRWGGPFQHFSKMPTQVLHGAVPNSFMHFAANLTRAS